MVIYLVLFVVLLFFSIYGVGKRMLLLILLIMSFVLGFRSEEVGTDTSGYIDYYNSLTLDIFSGYMEKGWNSIAIICKFFNLSAYGFHFIISMLTLLPVGIACLKIADDKITGLVFFLLFSFGFYFHMFNIMRQLLAMSIVLLGYVKLAEGRKRSFMLCIFIASFIHLASMFALLMLITVRYTLTIKRVIFILVVSFIVGIVASESFFRLFAGKFAHDIDDFGFRMGANFILIVGGLTNLFTLWLYKMVPQLSNNVWVKFNIFSVVIFNLASNLVMGARLVYFFSICSIITYSLYAVSTKKKIVPFMIYLFAIVTFIRYLAPEVLKYGMDGSLVPYAMNFQIFAE